MHLIIRKKKSPVSWLSKYKYTWLWNIWSYGQPNVEIIVWCHKLLKFFCGTAPPVWMKLNYSRSQRKNDLDVSKVGKEHIILIEVRENCCLGRHKKSSMCSIMCWRCMKYCSFFSFVLSFLTVNFIANCQTGFLCYWSSTMWYFALF